MSETFRPVNKSFVYLSVILLVISFNINPINDYGDYDTFDVNDWQDLDQCNELSADNSGPGDIYCMKFSQISVIVALILAILTSALITLPVQRSSKKLIDYFGAATGLVSLLIAFKLSLYLLVLSSGVYKIGGGGILLYIVGIMMTLHFVPRLKIFHSKAKAPLNNISETITNPVRKLFPYGRKDPNGSKVMYALVLILIASIAWLQPAVSLDAKLFFLVKFITLASIFAILSISLNIHTGFTGMVNFGVIFFAGIGAISSSLLVSKYGWDPLFALLFGVVLAGIIGFLLAFPTIRLRSDYFAIVTVSLGELLRVLLKVDPNFQSRAEGSSFSTQGISNYDYLFETWWNRNVINQSINLPLTSHTILLNYDHFLMVIALVLLILCFVIAEMLFNSPYGRLMKTIREDEDVVESYGHNVFMVKAVVLGLGASIAAIGGSLWAMYQGNIFPDFMDPATSTFLIWAAFILGGMSNNKGMIVGGAIIVLAEFVFNNLAIINRSEEKNLWLDALDAIYRFIVVDIGGKLFGEDSWTTFGISIDERSEIVINVIFLKFVLIGLMIIIMLVQSEEGILPELPYRPRAPVRIESEKRSKYFGAILSSKAKEDQDILSANSDELNSKEN